MYIHERPAAVFALLTLATLTSGQGMDSIQVPGTNGCTIVELVLERIETRIMSALYPSPATSVHTIASIPNDVARQAIFWLNHYHTEGLTVGDFIFMYVARTVSTCTQLHLHTHSWHNCTCSHTDIYRSVRMLGECVHA